jgi:hypothetical protein
MAADFDAKADVEARRSAVDARVGRERLKDKEIASKIMSPLKVRAFADELQATILKINCARKDGCANLADMVSNVREGSQLTRAHPYCLGYNVGLLINMEALEKLLWTFQAADEKTLVSFNVLMGRQTANVGGLTQVFEKWALFTRIDGRGYRPGDMLVKS